VTGVRVALLALGVLGAQLRPARWPRWVVPVGVAAVAVVVGAAPLAVVGEVWRPFAAPLAFLILAVPMAVLLDELGLFVALAGRIDRSRHLPLGLWVLGAAVTAVFNLDAAVVLLTPLFVQVARRHGLDVVAFAFPPVLLAMFASSVLPVSNLTNLLAASRLHLGAADFLVHLGPASLAASVVGYVAWRRCFGVGSVVPLDDVPADGAPLEEAPIHEAPPGPRVEGADPRAWRLAAPIAVAVLVGFTVGDVLGVPAWAVAGVADVVLLAATRRMPWRTVPLGTAALAAALGILATAASSALHVDRLVGRGDPGVLGLVAIVVTSAIGANVLDTCVR
jgi:arsenical pump membrane protein